MVTYTIRWSRIKIVDRQTDRPTDRQTDRHGNVYYPLVANKKRIKNIITYQFTYTIGQKIIFLLNLHLNSAKNIFLFSTRPRFNMTFLVAMAISKSVSSNPGYKAAIVADTLSPNLKCFLFNLCLMPKNMTITCWLHTFAKKLYN